MCPFQWEHCFRVEVLETTYSHRLGDVAELRPAQRVRKWPGACHGALRIMRFHVGSSALLQLNKVDECGVVLKRERKIGLIKIPQSVRPTKLPVAIRRGLRSKVPSAAATAI